MKLVFEGGPAEGEQIIMAVLPGKRRWHVKLKGTERSWWCIDREPPQDPARVEITRYDLTASQPDEEEGMIHTFTAEGYGVNDTSVLR